MSCQLAVSAESNPWHVLFARTTEKSKSGPLCCQQVDNIDLGGARAFQGAPESLRLLVGPGNDFQLNSLSFAFLYSHILAAPFV